MKQLPSQIIGGLPALVSFQIACQDNFFCLPGLVIKPEENPFNQANAEEKERILKTDNPNQLIK